jgi:hypothetical protein
MDYVELLIDEWRIPESPRRLRSCLRRVLRELEVEALLTLGREPRLEVIVCPEDGLGVWAYFPIHRRRLIAQQCKPRPATRGLLVFNVPVIAKQPTTVTEDQMRDHLGHMLLYLRSPKARNECIDAQREWRGNARSVAKRS